MGNDNYAREFRIGVQKDAGAYLIDLVGEKRGKMAAARVGMAFAAAARSAKDPGALYDCSRASIVACIGNSALANLMPGGAHPRVWLIPKAKELQWWLSHRGIATLALRAGYQLYAVPVHVDDDLTIEFNEVTAHVSDPDGWARSLEEVRGVYLSVRRLSDGCMLGRPWLPVAAIHERRKKALTQAVWTQWPVEQAQKTCVKWAMARGILPIDSDEIDLALGAEPRFIDADYREVETTARPTGKAALGLGGDPPRRELTDGQDGRDLEDADAEAGERRRAARVRVERTPPTSESNGGQPEPPLGSYDDEAPE